ncbi:MAG: diacylglycerol kinase family lipid kinase [Lachnospiraceae bacterium]|nr:diacylglycerol kinase family lipid kinase [Lachnospiraceae bacterium]
MYYFIVNPHSRSGKGLGIWNRLKKQLDQDSIPYEVYMTERMGHATEIAGFLTSPRHPDKTPKTIIALGGDGTLNEVLNGISMSAAVTLGYIPSGSGNDFSRGMKLPRSSEKALTKLLHTKRIRVIDYGILSYTDGRPAHRRFIVSSGIGYDAEVCQNLFFTRLKKLFNWLHMGKLVYLVIGVKQIILCRSTDGCLVLDGVKKVNLKKIRFISSHIQKYEGGGFRFAPKADPADGYLDLCVVSGVSRLRLTWLLAASLMGKHVHCKGVRTYSCREASIHTDQPLSVHADGESCGRQTDISIRCVERKVSFLA